MRRLLPALALLALALPAPAGAKGLVALSVCGSNGCHGTRDQGELAHALDSVAQANPGQRGAFLRLRATIGEPGRPEALGHSVAVWMPEPNVIRGNDGPFAGYTMPDPALKAALVRLARGLQPFGETVQAPAADGGGAGWALWALLAIPLAGLLMWRRRLA